MDLTAMHWLPRQRVDWPVRAHLVLVGDHVAQALVVDDAHEDLDLHFGAVESRVHGLCTVVRVPRSAELLAEVVNSAVPLRKGKRRGVLPNSVRGARLARHGLEQHTNRHPAGETVRVEENVWGDARLRKRHVLRRPQPRHDAFLPVARRELVTRDGVAPVPQLDEDAAVRLVHHRRISANHTHLFHNRRLGRLVALDQVLARAFVVDHSERVLVGQDLPNVRKAVKPKARFVLFCLVPHGLGGASDAVLNRLVRLGQGDGDGVGELVPLFLPALVHLVQVDALRRAHGAVAKPTVVRRLVDDHRVLHVVPRVRDDGDDCVGT
mmetsp:Transcript_36434/g.80059  ORF Transcript_36434/g.80059 Transcript_36434/m.80059 type:complete len:323 (-) Transcript_36434:147-1115(-)